MNSVQHEMIMASAGSGKTYALTNRYVRLLTLGADPTRIVALTFTRKAAGEFFDEILNKLANAASSEAEAAKLSRELGVTKRGAKDYVALLRLVVDAMPRLALGTFDAFFARIVRTFPLELGLGGDFTLLEEYAAQYERRRVMRDLFAWPGREPDEAQSNFIESFKRATFGREEKRLARLLDGFLDAHHHDFLAAPEADLWGNAARIWPERCAWLESADLAPAVRDLREWILQAPNGTWQRERWLDFLEALETYAPGVNPPNPLMYVLKKVLEAWPAILRGDAVLEFNRRRQELSPAACAALRAITQHLFSGEYLRSLAATSGLHGILARYDEGYENLVRRAGRLTFSDVERLLRAADVTSARYPPPPVETSGQLMFAFNPGAEESAAPASPADRRLLLEWRLDGQFDHWLLDEFQDTSRGQWDVLRNLIDEVIQDPTLTRTFFCVGDVKQAIYSWRGGDSRLFGEILAHYNATGGSPAIQLTPLDMSYRSGPAVLAMVNRVFGDSNALAEISPVAGAQWSANWREHGSAGNAATLPGHAAWLHAADEADRFQLTLDVIRELRPLARGLSVAVLTQKNDTARRLADHLRREGQLAAVAEADLHVCIDNPATAAVLAVFKAAAHPGDSLAWTHAQMTPLREACAAAGLTTPAALSDHLLRQVHREGFEATVEWWWRRLEPHLDPDDAFTHGRGRHLVDAARKFDDSGMRDIAEFLQFTERHVVRDVESPGVVRVMTIHKSKGLGFDIVILPDLEGDKLASRRDGLAVHRDDENNVEWVLDLPNKFFHEQDPVLQAHVAIEEAEASLEKFSLLYVALTRAKRAMYLISTPGTKTKSLNYPRLLSLTLGEAAGDVCIGSRRFAGAFETGDPQWFEHVEPRPEQRAPAAPRAITAAAGDLTVRFLARTPSDQRRGLLRAEALFAPGQPSASVFGSAVHDAFAAVEWWNPADAPAWEAELRRRGIPEDAIAAARACLEAPSLADVFQRRSQANVETWREKSFEFVHEGTWITGRFDRVLVERDAAGRATFVHVFDFKTDRAGANPDEWAAIAERYRSQVVWYRRAAARLAGVPEDCVSCALILTSARDAGGQPPAPLVLT